MLTKVAFIYIYISDPKLLNSSVFKCRITHPKEFLKKLFGAINVNAGNAAITSQHSIHSGRDILPVMFCLRVKGCLVFYQAVFHLCATPDHRDQKKVVLPVRDLLQHFILNIHLMNLYRCIYSIRSLQVHN